MKKVELQESEGALRILHIEIDNMGNEKIISIQEIKPIFRKIGVLALFTSKVMKDCFDFLGVRYLRIK